MSRSLGDMTQFVGSLVRRISQRVTSPGGTAVILDSRTELQKPNVAALMEALSRRGKADFFEYGDFEAILSKQIDFPEYARRSADWSVVQLANSVDALFTSLPTSGGVESVYRAWLTYKLLQADIPKLARQLGGGRLSRYSTLALQTHVPPEVAYEILRWSGLGSSTEVTTFSGAEPSFEDTRFDRWRTDGVGAKRKKKFSDGVAFLVGTTHEAHWMSDLADDLPNTIPLNFILKKKNTSISAWLASRWSNRTVAVSSWQGLLGCLTPAEHIQLVGTLQNLHCFLLTDRGETLRSHSSWIATFFDIAVGAIGLNRWLGPKVVVGSLEKSPQGLVLSALGPELGMKTFNIQHGLIGRQRTLDLLCYDVFGIWRTATRRVLSIDNYPTSARVEVIGRPAMYMNKALEVDPFSKDLSDWIGSRRAITLFLQPIKPPYVRRERLEELISALVQRVSEKDDEVLLVKPHPTTALSDLAKWMAIPHTQSSVRFVQGEQASMATVLGATDVALSLSSTALQDADEAGCFSIAFDPDAVLDILQLDFTGSIAKVASEHELWTVLDRASACRRPPSDRLDFRERAGGIIRELVGI